MNDNILIRFYQFLLTFYPADFREQHGDEMVAVFAEGIVVVRRESRWAMARHALRELVHYPTNLFRAYARGWRQLQPAPVDPPALPWVAGWTLLSSAVLPVAWFLFAPLGLLFLPLLDLLPGSAMDGTVASTLGLITALGLVTALAQWLLLRRHLAGAGWWIPLTLAGWLAAGGLILLTISLVDVTQFGPGVAFVLVGLCVGGAQWLFLRCSLADGNWWLPVTLLASGSVLLAGETFESIPESLLFLTLPWLLTGAFLWLLLQRAPVRVFVPAAPSKKRATSHPRRWPLYAALAVLVLAVASPWAYAVGHLELAKRGGIHASPEARIRTWAAGVEGVQVERVDMVVDSVQDGLPHVRWAGAYVTFDGPHPATGRRVVSIGGDYIRVEEGWVSISEGAIPTLIGRLMELYGLEGAGRE